MVDLLVCGWPVDGLLPPAFDFKLMMLFVDGLDEKNPFRTME